MGVAGPPDGRVEHALTVTGEILYRNVLTAYQLQDHQQAKLLPHEKVLVQRCCRRMASYCPVGVAAGPVVVHPLCIKHLTCGYAPGCHAPRRGAGLRVSPR